jgi:hypothetical protein
MRSARKEQRQAAVPGTRTFIRGLLLLTPGQVKHLVRNLDAEESARGLEAAAAGAVAQRHHAAVTRQAYNAWCSEEAGKAGVSGASGGSGGEGRLRDEKGEGGDTAVTPWPSHLLLHRALLPLVGSILVPITVVSCCRLAGRASDSEFRKRRSEKRVSSAATVYYRQNFISNCFCKRRTRHWDAEALF